MQHTQQQSSCTLFPMLAVEDEQPKQQLSHLRGCAALESLPLHSVPAPLGFALPDPAPGGSCTQLRQQLQQVPRCPGLCSFGQIPISLGEPLTKTKSRNTAECPPFTARPQARVMPSFLWRSSAPAPPMAPTSSLKLQNHHPQHIAQHPGAPLAHA